MSRKRTAALVAVLGINFALAGGAIMLANLNKPLAYDGSLDAYPSNSQSDAVAGVMADPASGDLRVTLKAAQQGGNTRVSFTCGKSTPAGREVHEGTWDQIAGAVLYRPESGQLLAVEAVFDTRSLRTDAQGLTNTVTAKEKWFDIDNHPGATFTCSSVTPADAATPSHTHDLTGTFTLNGISHGLTIPARLSFAGQGITIDASFTILRSEYKVQKRENSIAGSLGGVVSKVEDEVELTVRVNASPDPTAALADLAQLLEEQKEQLRIASVEIGRLKGLEGRISRAEDEMQRLAQLRVTSVPAVEINKLPSRFTDKVPSYEQVPIDMVLIPGDPAKGIEPFYICTTEVTWGMLDKWMYVGDLDGQPRPVVTKLIDEGLRPTPLFEEPAQFVEVKRKNKPAVAMAMLTAKSYCKWLSEQTGRTYRLPTLQEWMHVAELGGGRPTDLDAYAWHLGNAEPNEKDKPISGTVASKLPNKLGIYDMFGNAAEWVTGTGEDEVVVGGSFQTPAEEITLEWRSVASLDVWSANYPQFPKSRFWYSDFYCAGIRLICEPASVAANPPKDSQ